jgi:protein-S-isoprenylcysteine O-methyltransferase Ste14
MLPFRWAGSGPQTRIPDGRNVTMPPHQAELLWRSMRGGALFILAAAGLLFLPAWTLDYWQAWLYLAVLGVVCFLGTLHFVRHDPALVERRLSVGPAAEKERSQKVIMTVAAANLILLYVAPGLDRHFHWSHVPWQIVLIADSVVIAGYLGIFRVFKENSYAAATVGTAADQKVIASGPYALVRHPMYSAALIMFAAQTVALGSSWSLLLIVPLIGVFAWRLLDEERVLRRELPGYIDYCDRVSYRLVPGVW